MEIKKHDIENLINDIEEIIELMEEEKEIEEDLRTEVKLKDVIYELSNAKKDLEALKCVAEKE